MPDRTQEARGPGVEVACMSGTRRDPDQFNPWWQRWRGRMDNYTGDAAVHDARAKHSLPRSMCQIPRIAKQLSKALLSSSGHRGFVGLRRASHITVQNRNLQFGAE